MRNARPESCQGRFECVARQRVGVFSRREPFAESQDRDAVDGCRQDAEHRVAVRAWREFAGVDHGLNLLRHALPHLAHEAEPLPVAADPRHRAVDEHQREVFRVGLAELIEAPEARADRVHRANRRGFLAARKQQPEALLGKRQEDVVLAREVPVDGRRAVFDFLGDLADRDVVIALGDEQLARGIENRPRDSLPISFLPFLDAQWIPPNASGQ